MLDTSVAVDHLRGLSAARDLILDLVGSQEELVASEVVRFEVVAGVRNDEVELLEGFFGALGWVPVDETIARAAGSLARRYRASHAGIGDADYFVAATALALDAELLTTNVRHFPMFEGLRPPYS